MRTPRCGSYAFDFPFSFHFWKEICKKPHIPLHCPPGSCCSCSFANLHTYSHPCLVTLEKTKLALHLRLRKHTTLFNNDNNDDQVGIRNPRCAPLSFKRTLSSIIYLLSCRLQTMIFPRQLHTSPNRIQKRQQKNRRTGSPRVSNATITTLYRETTPEIQRIAMFAQETSGRQDSCSFRTRLVDEEPLSTDLNDNYGQHTTPLGIHVTGNPCLSPADMLFPEACSDNVITQAHSPTKSGSNNSTNFSFFTVEEFSDTEMVDPLQDNNTPSNPKKRKPLASMPSPHARKRLSRTTVTARSLKASQPCHGRTDDDDISDDWSIITDIDMSRIPTFGPSDVMKQSVQAILMRRAVSKARAARRRVRTLERSCRTLFRSAFETGHGGPTKCVSVGTAW